MNVLLILDGFAYRYLENPIFDKVKKKFNLLVPMKPTAGWSSKPTLYTGNDCITTDLFTQYWLSNDSEFKWLKTNKEFLSPFWSAIWGGFFRKFLGYKILPNTNIPLNALQYFSVSEGYLNSKSLKRPIGLAAKDLKIIYDKSIDEAGHVYGPNADETFKAIKKSARKIEKLMNDPEIENLFVVGDHGMSEINARIDIFPLLESYGLKFGEGLFYFIDSTMIRFWFTDKKIKAKTLEALKKLTSTGTIITEKDFKKYGLDFPHNKYAELIFWLDRGLVFKPFFYHRWTFGGARKNKGMHGYLTDQTLFGVFTRKSVKFKKIRGNVEMTRFYPTVMEVLGKSYECEGVSLVR